MFTVIIFVCSLSIMCMPSFVFIGCVSELHAHLHVCPYRNVYPEVVYCCLPTFLYAYILVFTDFHPFIKFHPSTQCAT